MTGAARPRTAARAGHERDPSWRRLPITWIRHESRTLAEAYDERAEVVSVTTTVQQVLDRFAGGLDEADFAVALDAQLAGRRWPGTVGLTSTEQAFLAGEGITVDGDPSPEQSLHEAADRVIDLTADSWSAAEAAEKLGVDASRVRHRVADRSLYAYRLGRQLRLPHWQFTDRLPAEPLPNLRRVLTALPDDMAPVELARLVTTPQPDLALAGAATAPRDWLLAGQSAEPVRHLVENLYQW
jgi:hypothetical protein